MENTPEKVSDQQAETLSEQNQEEAPNLDRLWGSLKDIIDDDFMKAIQDYRYSQMTGADK